MNLHGSTAGGLVALLGCATATGADSLSVRSLAKGGFSGIQEAKQEVIKSRAAWEKLWTQHQKSAGNATPLPEVDFSKEMVIVATMGMKRTGGYSIEITGAEVAGKKVKVSVREASPSPGALTTQALTAPFHFVAVPKSDLKAEFVEVKAAQKR